MMKTKFNAIVNILAFISGIFSVFSGLVLFFALPAGQQTGRLSFWGLTKFEWIRMHNLSSFILVGLVLLHLILHWTWIKNIKRILFCK